jgi:hypothetical protein
VHLLIVFWNWICTVVSSYLDCWIVLVYYIIVSFDTKLNYLDISHYFCPRLLYSCVIFYVVHKLCSYFSVLIWYYLDLLFVRY